MHSLDQANPFAYNCSFSFYISYTNVMLDPVWGREGYKNAQKQIIIKAHQVTNFVQTCSLLFIYNSMTCPIDQVKLIEL